jgi:ketosteroid isomerase-like protein
MGERGDHAVVLGASMGGLLAARVLADTNAFLERVLTATEVDPVVAGQFMRITAMVDPPVRLLRPSILLRVARARAPRNVTTTRKGIPMSNQNIETTKKGYAAFNAGDLETALSVFADTVEWTIGGESMISGTYRGKGELTELLAQLAQKSTSVEAKSFLADGDVVVVLTEVTAGGETSQEADVYTFASGKIVQAQSFGDTAMQERIFGSKRVAAS